MNFDSIRIILVETSHPGNIGSAARAMKTMGLKRLYLVSPKTFPDVRAVEMAAGAEDVLNHAIVTDTLSEALENCHLILATSARPRGIALPGLTPKEQAILISQQPDDTNIAILFGREHSGLTNEELLRCHYHINIPSNPDYSSLNLSQAVQIVAYELRMRLLSPLALVETEKDSLASAQDIERFYDHLKSVLIDIEFLKPSNPRRLMQRIRRLFNRAKLETMEINILRGILTQIQRTIGRQNASKAKQE
ncbi:tRNA (cytosine(32)/uridine(32)-2'-O)-methyltransferase TrmJ [Legionella impletisoli]|uniref:tRNA (cytidine/uridine-2'-O-)-methyltransferase TrmJ n=1 Tax=Legionella impletisoli TaxID=343510 RepID=A0A917JSQ9_9GAMM|nr:tRNA (cytosine(32)/uridine(32)-2'-O)-methyltransferase TrmJ [Legionella impletisoli]GGI79699.1 tRNA (cytidine/uridine-2'-O-)-methyltransferase TrmJ [Legionella impletisoli]